MKREHVRLRRLLRRLDRFSLWVGRVACFITLIMMACLLREIIGRYFFNNPSGWVNEINQYLLCAMTMLGGAYCVVTDSHIRVDIFYTRFSPRSQAAAELLTAAFPLGFMIAILWFGGQDTWEALDQDKRSMSHLALPLFPTYFLACLGTFFMLLQFLVRLARDVLQLISGRMEHPPSKELFE